ncbi:helix-turn-helix transcriptional regulator [Actinophytocola oryzae]|uniref:Regulatory LuxR family protein n=1 Tax=Actinophytocola oryzae TaxID=502181 RepID=A0A4R7VFH3_9PSEU|nr:AAA family ATPase [Actinophytocola oryzae]TDV47986.1 regulatory LuxR family protein [Actinophytocola oryzae]
MLAEREGALAVAGRALAAAAAGDGGLLVITGSPGTGRSALLSSVVDLAGEPPRVLRADATLAERDFDLGVVQQLVRPLVDTAPAAELDRWFSGAAALARPLLTDGPDAGTARGGELPGLHALVVNLSADRPVLLAVDDLQWTDRSSLRWLAYLVRRLSGTRVLVVATAADGYAVAEPALVEDICTSATRTVQVSPLTAAGVGAVVAAEYAARSVTEPVDPAFARACHHATGGNPAALLAVLHGLQAKGVRPVAAAAETVRRESHALLRARRLYYLDTQPPPVRTVARALAVLGDQADHDLIGEVAGLDGPAYKDALQALDRLGLLAGVGPPRLADLGVRTATEAAIPVAERDRLHRVAAMALHDAGRSAEDVATQLSRVHDHQPWETDLLRSAAATALDRGAADEAVRYLRHALLAGSSGGPERARLLVDLAAAERGVDPVAAVGHIVQALPDLPAGPEHAAAVLSVPFALAARSPSVSTPLRAGAEAPDPGLAAAYPDLALRLEARGRAIDDHDPVRLADAVARLRGLDPRPLDTPGGRELLAVLANAASVGASTTATEVGALGVALLDREDPGFAHVHTAFPVLVTALVAAGEAGAAGAWLDRVWRRARPKEPAGPRAAVLAERAAVLLATGSVAEARSLAGTALETAGTAWPGATALARVTLTGVAMATNDVELARRVLDDGDDAADPGAVLTSLMARGLVDAVRGDHVAALDKMLEYGDRAARYGWTNPALFPWRTYAAALYQRLGDVDAAVALAEREHAAAVAWGEPGTVGRALRLRGTVLGGEEGLTALRAAVARLRDAQDAVELSRALVLLGRGLATLGDPGAGAALAEADRIASACGGVWAAVNPEVDWSGPVLSLAPGGGVTELSKAELTVLALVVRGLTNQRIADILGITRRAVEKSLTGSYRKLGVSGRAAVLAQWRSLLPDLDPGADEHV